LGQAKKEAFASRFIGRPLDILLEGKRSKTTQFLSGLTQNYIRVHVDAPEAFVNQLVPVRLVRLAGDEVLGEWPEAHGIAVEQEHRANAAPGIDLHTLQ